MTYWKNKVVVITGGSAGLGLELAKAFVAQHATVALVARNEERLAAACETLGPLRGSTADGKPAAHSFSADITDPQQVEGLKTRVVEQFGRVDALVNCAGKSARGAILETTPEQFREMFELNFLSVVNCTRAFMPSLIETKGHVVNIGSLASKSASRFLGAYPATKFPVAAYSQQLRLELSESGVHVLLACPGPIARNDSGHRYAGTDVPEEARKPGGGVKLKGLDPAKLSSNILYACERRQLELVMPWKARLLFVISQASPRWGDWLITKMTS